MFYGIFIFEVKKDGLIFGRVVLALHFFNIVHKRVAMFVFVMSIKGGIT